MRVSAVIVTRGDVDLSEVLASLPFDDVVVHDNSKEPNGGCSVYGRYKAIARAKHPFIYVQDDDCVLEPGSIAELASRCLNWHHAWPMIFANMPERFRPHYPDSCLVGFGAVFHRDLPWQTFERYFRAQGRVRDLLAPRVTGTPEGPTTACLDVPLDWLPVCDVTFTTLNHRSLLDLPYRDLPWADAPNRMWKQPDHVASRARALELARRIRDTPSEGGEG